METQRLADRSAARVSAIVAESSKLFSWCLVPCTGSVAKDLCRCDFANELWRTSFVPQYLEGPLIQDSRAREPTGKVG
jgi:hypothetical protein